MTFSSLFFDRRSQVRRLAAAIGLTVALVASAIIPSLASAAQITTRSIALSSSIKGTTDVQYNLTFTAASTASAVIVDFCKNSPDVTDATCSAPTGFDTTNVSVDASSTSTGFTATSKAANTVELDGSVAAGSNNIVLDHIDNPTTTDPFYARILTYGSTNDAGNYQASDKGTGTGVKDVGGVAMVIQDGIAVSGSVLESMTFCVASVAPTANCANAAANLPTLKLGQTVGSATALQAGVVSSGSLYAQLSTNALHGAVVSLKSDATSCGGLELNGVPGSATCGIAAALASDIITNDTSAKFGVKVGTLSDPASTTGTGSIAGYNSAAYYNPTTYAMKYVAGNGSGVTGPYGDLFLDTAGAPVNNKNIELNFGATVINSTPAGNYSAGLNMIATGTF
jgi:hypothetical protein